MSCRVSLYSFPKWECKECTKFGECKERFTKLIVLWERKD